MDRDLIINLKLNRTQANQQSQQFHSAEKNRIKELLSEHEIAERAKLAIIERTNKQKIAEAAKATKTEIELAKEAAKEAERLAKESAAAASRAEKEKTQAAREAAKEAERLAKEAERASEKAKRDEVAATKRAEREKLAAAKQYAKEREQTVKAALQSEKEAYKDTEDAVSGLMNTLSSFGGQMIGISGIGSVMSAIVDNFELARKSAYDAGQMVKDYREALIELAALKGKFGKDGGGTTAELREQIAFRRQTLQTAEEARDYQNVALGVGESLIDTKDRQGMISPGDWKKLVEYGGKLQVSRGLKASTAANLIGTIPQLVGHRTNAEESIGLTKQVMDAFQPGKFTPEQAASQIGEISPLVQMGTYKPAEAAAMMAMMSMVRPESAGTMLTQFTRGTIGNVGRQGRVTMEGGEKVGAYFKSLGVTDEMIKKTGSSDLAIKIGTLVANDLAKQKKAAEAAGEQFQPEVYMMKHGFMEQESRTALMGFAANVQSGQWENRFRPTGLETARPSSAAATADVDRALLDPAFRGRREKLAADSAKLAVGVGAREDADYYVRIAFEKLKAQGLEQGEFDDIATNTLLGSTSEFLFGRKQKAQREAQRLMEEEAVRVGLPVVPAFDFSPVSGPVPGNRVVPGRKGYQGVGYYGDEYLTDLARKVEAANGNPNVGADKAAQVADAQIAAAQAQKEAAQVVVDAIKSRPLPTSNPPPNRPR